MRSGERGRMSSSEGGCGPIWEPQERPQTVEYSEHCQNEGGVEVNSEEDREIKLICWNGVPQKGVFIQWATQSY